MLMLKLQYFGHLMQKTDSLEKTLMLGKIEGRRRGDRMRWLDITQEWNCWVIYMAVLIFSFLWNLYTIF